MEVGVYESLQMLKSDVHFWLTKSNGHTKLVIIIHIDKVSRKDSLATMGMRSRRS